MQGVYCCADEAVQKDNKEAIAAKKQQYLKQYNAENNREAIAARQKQYRQDNRESIRC